MVMKSLECAILSLLQNVPVWIFNLTGLPYFTSFAYSSTPVQTGLVAASNIEPALNILANFIGLLYIWANHIWTLLFYSGSLKIQFFIRCKN